MSKENNLGITKSICHECEKIVPAVIIERDGSIYLLKDCGQHGTSEALLEEDAAWFKSRMSFNKPGTPFKPETSVKDGCPFDCGLCPDHDQHTCIGVVEVGTGCDLSCPVCYAKGGGERFLDFAQITKMIDYFVEAEGGSAEILQLSGGEPTRHPRILEILDYARTKPIKHIMLNTNGVRIAKDLTFAKSLSQYGGGFEVYLQFDGLSAETSKHFRGVDLTALKKQAVQNLSEYGTATTFAATLEQGVNEHEIAPILDFALKCKTVRGVNFQPLAFFGRLPKSSSTVNRLTLSGIIHRIEEQTNGMIRRDDFIPLPCNVHRVAITYLLRRDKAFIPITRDIEIKRYLDFLGNTFTFNAEELLAHAQTRISESADCCSLVTYLKGFLPQAFSALKRKDKASFVTENTFRISISSFVDIFNFESQAMKRECVHVITPDLKRIPFSAWNMFHRSRYAF